MPRLLARLRSLGRNLFRRPRVEADLHEELQEYVALLAAEKERAGLSPEQARRAAAVEVGGVTQVAEEVRATRTGAHLEILLRDLRHAARSLARQPGLTATVVASLALGIGGTTAVFSVLNGVLLRPLPFQQPNQLHQLRIFWGDFSASLSSADRLALREAAAEVAEIGGYFFPNDGFTLTTPEGPIVVQGAILTPELPRLLGVTPILGRTFTESSAREPIEILLGERFWREQMGAAPDIVGHGLTVDGELATVVGVMPAGFNVATQSDGAMWVRFEPRLPNRRGGFYLHTVARIPEGAEPAATAARLSALVAPVLRDRYGTQDEWRYQLAPLREALVGDVRPTLALLLTAAVLVLVIGVLNVSNLLLARGVSRRQELAIRAAVGAGRGRLARQLLTESTLLGLIGAALGLGIAALVLKAGTGMVLEVVPRMEQVRLDGVVVAFATLVGIGAGLLAGVVPAFRLPWTALGHEIREAGRGGDGGRRQGRTKRILVVAEVALALAVVTSAALLLKSLRQLQATDPGFQPAGVLTFRLVLPSTIYPDTAPARMASFLAELEPRLRALPGVESVAFAGALPPRDLQMTNNYTVENDVAPDGRGDSDVADWLLADPEYFTTMGIPVRRGRVFSDDDRLETDRVAVVNEAFVARHFPGTDPIGKRLKSGDWRAEAPWYTIVGVAGDVPYADGVWDGNRAGVYVAYAQNLWQTSPFVILKARGDPLALVPAARQTVLAVEPAAPLRDIATMADRLHRSEAEPRLRSTLFSGLALVTLLLALTGIYGVLAFEVGQRRRETAVRRALGATAPAVIGLVVGSGLRLVLLGLALGMVGAIGVTRIIAGFLFGVAPLDPGGLLLAAGTMLTVSLAASVIPAWRAVRVDPIAALRDG